MGDWEAGLLPMSLFVDKFPHLLFLPFVTFCYLVFNFCFSLSQVWWLVGRKEGWIVAHEPPPSVSSQGWAPPAARPCQDLS